MTEAKAVEKEAVEEAPEITYGESTEFLSDEARQAYIEALLQEKAGYEARVKAAEGGKADRGNLTAAQVQDRVDQVDAELARIGHGGKSPRKRGEAR